MTMDFYELVRIMETLRGKNGCPWDREQTTESIIPYLLEEAYEVIESLYDGDPDKAKEELGDLLFIIIFLVQIANERGDYNINNVIKTIGTKMVSRHPHVFGNAKFNSSEEVIKQWDDRKKEEGKQKESVLEGVPVALPSLLRAYRIQKRASKVGFDWERIDDVLVKLDEEISEFKEALNKGPKEKKEDELGDLLFTLVNIARFISINPEETLRKTIHKFIHRFEYIEKKAKEMNVILNDMSLEEMDALWEEAKIRGLER